MDFPKALEKAKEIAAAMEFYTPEQRMEIIDAITEDFCKLCGGPEKCYCASVYDE